MKTIFMETTSISAEKTAAEITDLLCAAGARQVAHNFDEKGAIVGLNFTLPVTGALLSYSLPVRKEALFRVFQSRRKYESDRKHKATEDRAKANRVGWRQLKRWVEAQLAMIKTGMVATEEVFLPYMLFPNGQTAYDQFREHQRLLPAPDGEIQ